MGDKDKDDKRIERKTGDGGKIRDEEWKPEPYRGGKKKRIPVWVKETTLDYEAELHQLQFELMKLQGHIKSEGKRLLVLFEGRDGAGKGGTIKRITQNLNPRGTRIVALPKPSDVERTQWYFQRYAAHLPSAGEIVLFDRSWYNRAMVEPVMGFCTDEENKRFLTDCPLFEQLLVKDGITLVKLYFSVSKKEQAKRFKERREDPMKHYKISPVDEKAQDLWSEYTIRKFQMLTQTNRTLTPWNIIRSDDKKRARLGAIRVILGALDYPDRGEGEVDLTPDPEVVLSGIDELRLMEQTLREDGPLMG